MLVGGGFSRSAHGRAIHWDGKDDNGLSTPRLEYEARQTEGGGWRVLDWKTGYSNNKPYFPVDAATVIYR